MRERSLDTGRGEFEGASNIIEGGGGTRVADEACDGHINNYTQFQTFSSALISIPASVVNVVPGEIRVVCTCVGKRHRHHVVKECFGGNLGAMNFSFTNLNVRIGVKYGRMNRAELYRNEIALGIDLQVQIGVKAEVCRRPLKDDVGASVERIVAVERPTRYSWNRKGENNASDDAENKQDDHEADSCHAWNAAETILISAERTPF